MQVTRFDSIQVTVAHRLKNKGCFVQAGEDFFYLPHHHFPLGTKLWVTVVRIPTEENKVPLVVLDSVCYADVA